MLFQILGKFLKKKGKRKSRVKKKYNNSRYDNSEKFGDNVSQGDVSKYTLNTIPHFIFLRFTNFD